MLTETGKRANAVNAALQKAVAAFAVLATSLLLCLFAAGSAYADSWSDRGNYDVSWYHGTGDYVITTASQLAGLSYLVSGERPYYSMEGSTFTLGNDIDISGRQWTPIGSGNGSTAPFCGEFDGAGHTISGLTITNSMYYQALFGCVKGTLIQNLTVKGEVTAGTYVAGIVALSFSSSLNNLTNYVSVRAVGSSDVSGSYVGSAAGIASMVRVTPDAPTYLQNLVNYGSVQGAGDDTGGIIASLATTGVANITQCANLGPVSCTAAKWPDNGMSIGGVIGRVHTTAGASHISECFNAGSITSSNLVSTGGVAGYVGGDTSYVSFCYNTGNISGAGNVGGVVASLPGSAAAITNTYSSGGVSGAAAAAIAVVAPSAKAASNFYLEGSANSAFSGGDIAGGGERKTYDEMTSQDLLDRLNGGTTLFSIDPQQNGGLPVLTWQGVSSRPGGGGNEGDGAGGNGGGDGSGYGAYDGAGAGGTGGNGDGAVQGVGLGSAADGAGAAQDGGQQLTEEVAGETELAGGDSSSVSEAGGGEEGEGTGHHLVELMSQEENQRAFEEPQDDTPWWMTVLYAELALAALFVGVFHEGVSFKFQRMVVPASGSKAGGDAPREVA